MVQYRADPASPRRWTSGPGRRTCAATGPAPSWTSSPRCAAAGEDAVRWRGVSTYLAKGVFLPGIDKPTAASAPADFAAPDPTALWQLGVDTGRAYAAVSGDFNPIHLSVLSAKALGMRRSIAHGMYLASRALADVGAAKGDAFSWDVAFEAPVFLPARVALDISTVQDGDGAWQRSGLCRLEPAFGTQALQRIGRRALAADHHADDGGGHLGGWPPPSVRSGLGGLHDPQHPVQAQQDRLDRTGGVRCRFPRRHPCGQGLDGGVRVFGSAPTARSGLSSSMERRTSPTAAMASASGAAYSSGTTKGVSLAQMTSESTWVTSWTWKVSRSRSRRLR